MVTKGWLLLIALAMVIIMEVSSQDCGQLLTRLREANQANLDVLHRNMGPSISQQCIDDVFSFSHREALGNINVSEEGNAKAAIQEVLQQTGHIFKQNYTEMPWDEDSLRAFHAGLDQQSENLKSCLSASPRIQLTRLRVKKYFRSLSNLLKEKEYSRCAWEIIQIQVKQCFLWIEKIIQEIQNKA
ncbi:interferon beta-like [Anolis carolinensis]|uniref:interferon beta-like n=1 Tax=Anolis carolinensis TaxID=28377 RepID=UPI00046268EB|nr:PREDICTED: interferon beta-like [Anolis carolinensis]|eukprot:XP_008101700.1 PREDICTED: interferon beta-like [Anolis carolinensis]